MLDDSNRRSPVTGAHEIALTFSAAKAPVEAGNMSLAEGVIVEARPRLALTVSTIDKYKNGDKYKSAGGLGIGMPLVVLTNEGSASASEIFSGAIRDYKVGTLVGKKTFGKGIVQIILTRPNEGFSDGSALKVTISKYYTPSGENIQGKGIKPDVEVDYPDNLKEKEYNRSDDPQFTKALQLIKEKIDNKS